VEKKKKRKRKDIDVTTNVDQGWFDFTSVFPAMTSTTVGYSDSSRKKKRTTHNDQGGPMQVGEEGTFILSKIILFSKSTQLLGNCLQTSRRERKNENTRNWTPFGQGNQHRHPTQQLNALPYPERKRRKLNERITLYLRIPSLLPWNCLLLPKLAQQSRITHYQFPAPLPFLLRKLKRSWKNTPSPCIHLRAYRP
jgi:hypothetical protein